MGKAAIRRTRKLRRLTKARLRTGKRIVTHKLKSGRTGNVNAKRLKVLKDAQKRVG